MSAPVRHVRATAAPARGRVASWLRPAMAVCVALAVIVPPFLAGGREAVGQSVLAAVVLTASGLGILRLLGGAGRAVAWRRPEVLVPAAWLLLLGLTWLHLPPDLVRALAPGVARLLPGWDHGTVGGPAAGGWSTFSLAPGLSRHATFLLLLPVLLFWVTLSCVRSVVGARRMLGLLFLCGCGVAVVGLLHYVFWNGKFYGFWELWWVPPDRQVRAPFTNRNHFAGFLALTIAPAVVYLGRLIHGRGPAPRWPAAPGGTSSPGPLPRELALFAAALGLVLILASILLSQSRGGTAAALVALAASAPEALGGRGKRSGSLVVVGCLLVAGLAIVWAFGPENPLGRLTALTENGRSLDQLSTHRLTLWKADLGAVPDFPLLGSGPGTHPYVYLLYLRKQFPVTFTHAENCYLQVLMECGVVGAVLLAVTLWCVGRWCRRSLRVGGGRTAGRTSMTALAVGVSLLAALLQGAVDYIWFVPAYASALAVLAALACRLARMRDEPVRRQDVATPCPPVPGLWARLSWCSGLALAWPLATVATGAHFVGRLGTERAWSDYLRLLPPTDTQKAAAGPVPPLEEEARLLEVACRCHADDPDVYYRLGVVEEQRFLDQARRRPSLTLAEVRLALRQRGAAAPAEVAACVRQLYGCDVGLLERAQAHFREAVRCCPLWGPAYIQSAELCFLTGADGHVPGGCCEQAVRVRPHDPEVWFEAGTEICASGDLAAAGTYWRRACELEPDTRRRLLPVLGAALPAERVVALLPLDLDCLLWLARQPQNCGRVSAGQCLAAHARMVVQATPALGANPDTWVSLHELYRDAGRTGEADNCLARAVRLAPAQPGYRVRLVQSLLQQGRTQEAEAQLEEAAHLFPADPAVLRLQEQLVEGVHRHGVH